MTLLPGGRLLHLHSLPDDLVLALEDIQALTAVAQNGRICAFAASEDRPGLNHLTIDPGALAPIRTAVGWGGPATGDDRNDLLVGRGGADTLSGGKGDDILIDSGGIDLLTGGAGADVFVLVSDGRLDTITDFQPGIDRLDLSDWGRLYDQSALGFTALPNGVQITFGTETLQLIAADGKPILPGVLGNADLFDLNHIGLNIPRDPARLVTGTAAPDVLVGANGNDTLAGVGAADRLSGAGGHDLLLGEHADAGFDPLSGQVTRLYLAVLGREPDGAGLMGWTGQLQAGKMTLTEVAGQFIASREFQATYANASNPDFVTLLYRNVLGREPDPGGLSSWLAALDSGAQSRASVVLGFSESAEFRLKTLPETLETSNAGLRAGWTDDVFRLYAATLDRQPDQPGLLHWTSYLARGNTLTDAAGGFIGSAEFQRIYGASSNVDLVRLLYGNVLDRLPDPAGLAHWTSLLDSGAQTRAQVVLGFSQSAEFRAKAAPSLEAYLRFLGEDDRLIGGDGNDTLFGGALSDTFVFSATQDGSDLVVGFEAWDNIALEGFGYASAVEALARFSETGGQAVFSDQGVRVTFHDTPLSMIEADLLILS
jgi:Ca2+-binding RTX toxin-like protein